MKQEEIEKLKAIIGEAAYNEEYGFIFNSKTDKLVRPFAYIYPSKEFDYKLLGQFIVDAINAKLASLDQTGIDGWISVEERKPEDGQLCFFYSKSGQILSMMYINSTWMDDWFKWRFSHWMPAFNLPLPPAPLEQFKNDEG